MDLEFQILKIFEKEPDKHFSATKIVKLVQPELFEKLNGLNKITDKQEIRDAKRDIVKVQKRILYHLNNFVSSKTIVHTKTNKKGSKFFKINMDYGNELHIKQKEGAIKIIKPLGLPLEGYEKQEIVKKFEQETWLNRVNSVLINCNNLNDKKIIQILTHIVSNVNDVIGFYNLEKTELNKDFFKKVEIICSDYDKKVNYIVKINKNTLKNVKEYFSISPKNGTFVFEIKRSDVDSDILNEIATMFRKNKCLLYLKNDDVHKPPYLIGKIGPYTFDKESWEHYKNNFEGNTLILICSRMTVLVDVKKYFEDNPNFNVLIKRIIHTLFKVSVHHRKYPTEYFKELFDLTPPNADHHGGIFVLGQNYIRLWNYEFGDMGKDPKKILSFLNETSESIKKTTKLQEIIYMSCGMPMRFNMVMSCSSHWENFSKPEFRHLIINKEEELYNEKIKNVLNHKEKIFKLFDGGDELRLIKHNELTPRETRFLMNCNLPLICCEFKLSPNYELTRFLE